MLRRGFGRHTRCLLTALVTSDTRNRYTFFVDSADAAALVPRPAAAHLVRVTTPTIVAASSSGPRRLRDLLAMSRALSNRELDVVLFPTLYSYVPTFGRARRVLMVHDASAEMYPRLTLGRWHNRVLWSAKTALGRWQADIVVTVSEYSRAAIARHLGIAADRIHVVGEAPDPVFRRIDGARPTPRLLETGVDPSRRSIVYLGGFSPHKNVDGLVRVFDRLSRQSRFGDVHLYLVGDHAQETFVTAYETVAELVDRRNLASRVTFTGFLPDDDLVVLLNLATVLALPSLTEGFGLPAIEAAACGCPVVATTESPLPGLLGAGGRFVAPEDEAELERALGEVLESPALQRSMRAAALAAASALSWPAAAARLVPLLEGDARP
jgi:glycosyltransferase involved in cell wall biosynthesis